MGRATGTFDSPYLGIRIALLSEIDSFVIRHTLSSEGLMERGKDIRPQVTDYRTKATGKDIIDALNQCDSELMEMERALSEPDNDSNLAEDGRPFPSSDEKLRWLIIRPDMIQMAQV